MSTTSDRLHREWLSLIDISGPFLTLPVLGEVFPQGLDGVDSGLRRRLRAAHDEWIADSERRHPDRAIHRAWVNFVLGEVLEWPGEVLAEGPALPDSLRVAIPEHSVHLRPDLALLDASGEGQPVPRVLVTIWPPEQDLQKATLDKRWAASPAAQMAELLRGAGVRLGLVTNGEQWMLVDAPRGETAAFVTWEATLWLDEPLTLQAFVSLLGVLRLLGVSEEQTLEALLARSKNDQAEVTTRLGNQVRHAVELLVRAIDRADQASNGELLADVSDEELYEATISVMMRLVFLLFAEDQRPPLLGGTPLYTENYAIAPLRDQLRASTRDSEDVLERRHDAWARLLATFRLVHAGSEHEDLRLPPYGGSLFDPDRFPFLEGRPRETTWTETPAQPLAIDNRTVLHLLDAIQQLDGQRLSFRGLDVEQIGHVYENLLGHVARRAEGPVLALQGKLEPEVALETLEAKRAQGEDVLIAFMKEETGRSASALAKAMANGPDLLGRQRLLEACANDTDLLERVLPYAGLIRDDDAGRPLVIPAGGRYVTTGSDRKNLGAHYTPRSLTEPIVRYALEPLVYDGPAEGKPAEEWTLHGPHRLLSLKICDPAMGSGAFLVQACRYLSERLVEAWDAIESQPGGRVRITPEGRVASGDAGEELLPLDRDERLAVARRIVADRCLYGVDKNHLAVEMAKLSLWLTTLQKDRPFTFVDHALRDGDSLLGIASLDQLAQWSLTPKAAGELRQTTWFTKQVHDALEEATHLRQQIATTDVRSVADAARKSDLLRRAELLTDVLRLGADMLVAAALHPEKNQREPLAKRWRDEYSVLLESLRMVNAGELTPEGARPTYEALDRLCAEAAALLGEHRPFHWPLDYPEVFALPRLRGESSGFAAIVGNPPFLGGKKITAASGEPYREYIIETSAFGMRGNADLVSYFTLRSIALIRSEGTIGLLATDSIAQGDSRQVGFEQIATKGYDLYRAFRSIKWPGTAETNVVRFWIRNGVWRAPKYIDKEMVEKISSRLTPESAQAMTAVRLSNNKDQFFVGTYVNGDGFLLEPAHAAELIASDSRNAEVLQPYLIGDDLTNDPKQAPSRWIVNFRDWPLDVAEQFPDCMAIVRSQVKPDRDLLAHGGPSARGYAERWWQFGRRAIALYEAIAELETVIAIAETSRFFAFSPYGTGVVFSHSTKVLASDRMELLGLLSSTVHESWAIEYAPTMGGAPRYTPTDCFETFPFPNAFAALLPASNALITIRRELMATKRVGLTELYGEVHNRYSTLDGVSNLRSTHEELDRGAVTQYGWDDLDLQHGFHDTALGTRFTISEAARRELLDRLLELNHQRHAEEVSQGLVDENGKILTKKRSGAKSAGARRKGTPAALQPSLGLT